MVFYLVKLEIETKQKKKKKINFGSLVATTYSSLVVVKFFYIFVQLLTNVKRFNYGGLNGRIMQTTKVKLANLEVLGFLLGRIRNINKAKKKRQISEHL